MSDRSNGPDCRAIGSQACEVGDLAGFEEPSSGIAISKAKAVMLDTPGSMLIRMAKRSARLSSASTSWRIAASTVAICRSICSRCAEHSDASTATALELFRGSWRQVRSLHQGLASDVKLLQFEQDLASSWARPPILAM